MSIDRIKSVAEQILGRLQAVHGKGEEATKQALVLPMLDALGYDIWHPGEVCPEYDADFPMRKAGQREKVDLAILIAGTPRIYIEVKSVDATLDGHEGQLARYFNATPAVALGVLTNGLEWRFFTDTGDPNVLDAQPFHVARLDAIDQGIDVMARFAKPVFSAEAIRDYATELRYTANIASFLRQELDLRDRDPSDYFLRWVLKSDGMYDGLVNAGVLDRFRPIAKAALARVVREIVRRSVAALDGQAAGPQAAVQLAAPAGPNAEAGPAAPAPDDDLGGSEDGESSGRGIETTEQELALFAVAKRIFDASPFATASAYDPGQRQDVPLAITYKDTVAYFAICLNKPNWWVARARLGSRSPWIAFNIDPAVGAGLLPPDVTPLPPYGWAAFRVALSKPEDLGRLAPVIHAVVKRIIDDRPARCVADRVGEQTEP